MNLLFLFIILFMALIIMAVTWNNIKTKNKNNQLSIKKVVATVIKKTMYSSCNGYEYYSITFEIASKGRFELEVKSTDYGSFTEGDHGNLTYQGTQFLSYQKISS